ncbi:MAG: c-type cytochrome [Deltaproteobacteria bacterium]|nr:c-type cytochrome [Deltaproteobacteria bacterium]NIS77845.1 c-type cytochrome [Deltaproteobacteria bacterium]
MGTKYLTGMLVLLVATVMTVSGVPSRSSTSGDAPWGKDYFPDVSLTTHEGNTVRFFDDLVEGKVVVINFIFTSCPDSCPLETAQLREVQKILGDRVGDDVFMYSITIDPEHDTPGVLREYAEKFEVGPGWLFLTGKKEDITLLRKKLGVYSEADENEDLASHSLNLVIGNQKTGKWMRGSPFENPYVLATRIGSWLHNWKLPPRKDLDYAKAPKLRKISKGESIFRTRCASCHNIEAKEVKASGRRPIGPNLFGVTRNRDRAWLVRWLAEPDKMLEEKDPIATALLAEYNNVPMPNLRLSKVDIEALIAYMEEETHRLEHLSHDHTHGHSGGHDHH